MSKERLEEGRGAVEAEAGEGGRGQGAGTEAEAGVGGPADQTGDKES